MIENDNEHNSTSSAKRKPWKKNLYENEGYEDNYTDPSFLQDLQKNRNVQIYTLSEALVGVTRLTLQISCITLFLLIFYWLYMEKTSPTSALCFTGTATLIGYILHSRKNISIKVIVDNSKTLLAVLVFGYIFSPLLHTLTNAVSTDTIFSMTFVAMNLHLIFFDYGLSAAIVSKASSLNCAIFGSICLASRLSSSYHAFVLLVIAAEFFALLPIYTRIHWHPFYIIPLSILCIFFLASISFSLLVTYIIVVIFINIVCPYLFVTQQKYKNNIHGPWDEAVLNDINFE